MGMFCVFLFLFGGFGWVWGWLVSWFFLVFFWKTFFILALRAKTSDRTSSMFWITADIRYCLWGFSEIRSFCTCKIILCKCKKCLSFSIWSMQLSCLKIFLCRIDSTNQGSYRSSGQIVVACFPLRVVPENITYTFKTLALRDPCNCLWQACLKYQIISIRFELK